jgi:hypothetical protein
VARIARKDDRRGVGLVRAGGVGAGRDGSRIGRRRDRSVRGRGAAVATGDRRRGVESRQLCAMVLAAGGEGAEEGEDAEEEEERTIAHGRLDGPKS